MLMIYNILFTLSIMGLIWGLNVPNNIVLCIFLIFFSSFGISITLERIIKRIVKGE